MNLFKILEFIHKGDKDRFGIPVDVQKEFLLKLGTPKDDLDRSYKQYQCQRLFTSKLKIIVLNVIASIVVPLLVLILIIRGLFIKSIIHKDAIASMSVKMNVFPEELLKEFNSDDELWGKGWSLRLKDIPFVMKVFSRGFSSPYFVLNSIILISSYSEMIKKYTPRALFSHCEYSFTSSLLTAYCRVNGVLHINTMHGDKFYHIRDSFVHFDRFYVWDEHYKNILVSMGAEPSQFRVFTPENLKFDCGKFENEEYYADYKYYLQIYTEKELMSIIQTLKCLKNAGFSYKLRPHPRYSDMKLLHKYVDEDCIENPRQVNIQESISNCKYVIGSFSTVLTQAYYSGKKVVIDDITYKDRFKQLKDIEYILITKDTIKLSEVI